MSDKDLLDKALAQVEADPNASSAKRVLGFFGRGVGQTIYIGVTGFLNSDIVQAQFKDMADAAQAAFVVRVARQLVRHLFAQLDVITAHEDCPEFIRKLLGVPLVRCVVFAGIAQLSAIILRGVADNLAANGQQGKAKICRNAGRLCASLTFEAFLASVPAVELVKGVAGIFSKGMAEDLSKLMEM